MLRRLVVVCGLFPPTVPAAHVTGCEWDPAQKRRVCAPAGHAAELGKAPAQACGAFEHRLQTDAAEAMAAHVGGSGGLGTPTEPRTAAHVTFVHIHGRMGHFYHFTHDVLFAFFPLYASYVDAAGEPSIARVYLWNRQSFGAFTRVFERVYSIEVALSFPRCTPTSTTSVSI